MNAIKSIKHIALVVVAAAGAAGFAGLAQADEYLAPASFTVHYGDLDLDTVAGANALFGRIQRAAQRVCEDAGSLNRLEKRPAIKACVDQAVSASVREVNREQLQRVAAAHGYAADGTVNVASNR